MALQPHGDTPSQADTTGNPDQSFRERKLAALTSEADPAPGTPAQFEQAESAQDAGDYAEPSDPYHPDEGTSADSDASASDDQDTDQQGALFEDEDATPDDQPDDTDEESPDDSVDWQTRYANLEKKFREVTDNRQAIEAEMTTTAERNVALGHELEDHARAAITRAKLFMDLANNQVAQFEAMDWNSVEPEQMAQAKAAYQHARQHRDTMVKAFQDAEQADKTAREAVRLREAERSRTLLPIKIPGWSNELYGTLRDFAIQRYGYTADEFNQITDHRPILMAHDALQANQAAEKVKRVKRDNKAHRPRNRNARKQPRNAEGRFQNARQKAFENPGDKGSFREMQFQKLQRERGERR